MDDIRKGQIALAYLKNKLREEGFHITLNLHRQINNAAKNIGISTEEATEFTKGIIYDLIEEAFSSNYRG